MDPSDFAHEFIPYGTLDDEKYVHECMDSLTVIRALKRFGDLSSNYGFFSLLGKVQCHRFMMLQTERSSLDSQKRVFYPLKTMETTEQNISSDANLQVITHQ